MELLGSTPTPHATAPVPAGDPAYYNIAQAAALLGVSRVTIWRWIRDGRLPATRLGHRTTRIRRADLRHMLREHERSEPHAKPEQDPEGNGWGQPACADWWAAGPSTHLVQFYDADTFLVDAVGDFIGAAL